MNARWFTPLLLLFFAAFVLGAKAYISRTPKEVIQPPAIAPASRIYGEIPAAARDDAALSRVFRPRPRSLDPLPIMAMTRPIPEPVRPAPGTTPKKAEPSVDSGTTAIAMLPLEPVEAPPAPTPKTDDGVDEDSTADSPSPAADEAATAIASVLKGQPVFAGETTEPESATSQPGEDDEAESSDQPKPPRALVKETGDKPPPLREALAAVVEQIDDAAVRLRSNHDNSPAMILTRALDSLAAGRFESALHDFDIVLARDVDSSQAWSGKGESLAGLNRFEDAATAYAKAAGYPACSITTKYNYGVVLYRLSRYADAGVQFRSVVASEPDHAEGHYNLATLAQRDGRLAEALESWKVFTRLRPTVAGGWFNLGIVFMDYDRPGEAVACFQRVIELDHNDADAHINLAMAHLASDQPAEALTALEAAESRLPGDRVVLRYLADVHSQLAETGGPDAAHHQEKATECRNRIASAQGREPRSAVAGASIDKQP